MKRSKKNKNINKNQASFYFEDFLETRKKDKILKKNTISHDRIYLLFFLFFSLILIFSLRIIHVSLNKIDLFYHEKTSNNSSFVRRDIVDRNGILISRNIKFFHAAINPKLVNNKDNFLIKLRLNFPSISVEKIQKNLKDGKYFYLKKRISQKDKEKPKPGPDANQKNQPDQRPKEKKLASASDNTQPQKSLHQKNTEALLAKIPDDPGGLLKQKFLRDYKRHQQEARR